MKSAVPAVKVMKKIMMTHHLHRRTNLIWSITDPDAPKICGSAELKASTQTCGLKRFGKSNSKHALYCCIYCQMFVRKAVFGPGDKDTRRVTMKISDSPELQHHASDCPHASLSWKVTVAVMMPGESLTVLGREFVVMSMLRGSSQQFSSLV